MELYFSGSDSGPGSVRTYRESRRLQRLGVGVPELRQVESTRCMFISCDVMQMYTEFYTGMPNLSLRKSDFGIPATLPSDKHCYYGDQ